MICEAWKKGPGTFQKIRSYGVWAVWLLLGLWIVVNMILAVKKVNSEYQFISELEKADAHILSRHKRFIYMDNNRRLCLPTGTILAFSGTLSLPFLGNLPIGYGSGLTISIPLTIKFDDLGLTSPDNRFGYLDFLNLRRFMNQSATIQLPATISSSLTNSLKKFEKLDLPQFLIESVPETFAATIGKYFLTSKRQKRSDWTNIPGVNYAGGDREMLFQMVEDFVSNFGFDGRSCILRTICEMHQEPLLHYGFFGEVLQLLLSPSMAAFAEYRLIPYLEAETRGKRKKECSAYHEKCPFSIFSQKTYSDRYPSHSNSTRFSDESYMHNLITNETDASNSVHHRQKRFFMFGPQRRIIFPPSTAIVVAPTLNLPFLRDLPQGYKSQLSYSTPFSLSFDDLGVTSVLNLFGNIPFLKRKKRSEENTFNYPQGDRELMYAVVADAISNIGMNGEACLLRAICEMQEVPLLNHGLLGELLSIFLTPSLAPKARERFNFFVKAELIGKHCGDCKIFHNKCSQSLFTDPGAGLKYKNEKEMLKCKKIQNFGYAEEKMNFVKEFKSKYKSIKKVPKPSVQFVQEIAKDINRKALFKNL